VDWTRWNRWRYTALAPGYDAVVGEFAKARRRSIDGLELPPGAEVLLVGAGTGLDLDHFPTGVKLTAVDLTPAMLARLSRRASRLGLEVETRVMDGERLEFPDASFHAVVAHLVLEVIPDPVRAIREMARVLKPGGRVAVFDKFLGDPASPSLPRRAANALTRVVGIDINRRFGPLVEASGLVLEWEEPLGLTGLFRLARLVKPSQAKEERA